MMIVILLKKDCRIRLKITSQKKTGAVIIIIFYVGPPSQGDLFYVFIIQIFTDMFLLMRLKITFIEYIELLIGTFFFFWLRVFLLIRYF